MIAKQLTYLLFITTLTFSCNRHWVRVEHSEQIYWEKFNSKLYSSSHDTLPDICSLIAGTITKTGEIDKFNYYEFDSIRIYVLQTDDLLNKLIQKGFIHGQYFFSPTTKNSCQPKKWHNPTKSEENNWFGYNIYLSGLREIKTTKFPKSLMKKVVLYKVFRLSYNYIGQPYINPEVFNFELINKDYKCNQDSISIDKFLEKAQTICFHEDGFEV